MSKCSAAAIAIICILLVLACNLATPTPAPTDTPAPSPELVEGPTETPMRTPTPVVVVVTATPEPTPTVDLNDLVMLPEELYRFAGQLVPTYGDDFVYAPGLGVARDTIVYLLYETPAGSGQFYVASYTIQGGQWLLLDTTALEEPTPTPTREWPEGEALR